MSTAKNGDTVKVHYTGKLENGEVFDQSTEGDPLEFTIGNGSIVSGFEKGVVVMEVGATKTITVLPEEGYEPRHEELVMEVTKTEFPEKIEPSIGQHLRLRQEDGNHIDLIITDMNEDTVTLDANHPLAGITLFFDVELVAIA